MRYDAIRALATRIFLCSLISAQLTIAHSTPPQGYPATSSNVRGNAFQVLAPGALPLDDVEGSFAPGTILAQKCPSAPVSVTRASAPMHKEVFIFDTWRRPSGDVEGITHVLASGNDSISITNSSREFFSDQDKEGTPSMASRTLCVADLSDSHTLYTGFSATAGYPPIFPGTTEFSVSAATLRRLRQSGEAPLDYVLYEFFASPGRWIPFPYSGVLKRVESTDVQYPMIVDEQSVMLPTVHAKGIFEFSGEESVREQIAPNKIKVTGEIFIMDDEDKPIVLLFKFDDPFQIQVVRLSYPSKTPATQIEQQLAHDKYAIAYGIYFDFNSDRLRPESQPVLKEIAEAMLHNPDWKLTLGGHTDNIGGDAKNLDLSERRSKSVRQALVEQYHLSATRLMTSGYGASRPVASNDTLSGRALNRRVELTRQ